MFSVFLWVVLFIATFYFELEKHVDNDLEQTLAMALQHLDEEHKNNVELTEMWNDLSQKYVMLQLSLKIYTEVGIYLLSLHIPFRSIIKV